MSTKNISPVKHSKQIYEDFLKQLRLLGLGLDSCSADLKRGLYFEIKSDEQIRQVAAEYEVLAIGPNYFNAGADFELRISRKGNKKREDEVALFINCSFVAHFHLGKITSKEYIKQFVNSEFRLIVWPYYRQMINDLTARMAIQPLIVPLFEPE